MRTARLRGGVALLSPEEDSRTSAEGGLPGRHVAVVCWSHLQTAGSRRWRRGKGGRFNHLPAAAVAATSVQGRIVAAAAAEAAAAAASALAARSHSDPDLGSNGGGRSGDGPPRRMVCGWGDHPHWVV